MFDLFGHPFSSYTWKAEIALAEKDLAFVLRVVDANHPDNIAELRRHWPSGKFPLLVDGERAIAESTTIIEYLDTRHTGARLVPSDANAAFGVRRLDRVFDNHVHAPMQAVVAEFIRDADRPDASRLAVAHGALDAIYPWLEHRLPADGWAAGGGFTLADCAAAPALFYADWLHPIPVECERLRAYRARLLARPSVARCVEAARPYRPFFPPGAPDRD